MNRALALVAVWLLFAGIAIGVGFAASGLIDEPLSAAQASPLEGSPVDPGPSTPGAEPGEASGTSTARSSSAPSTSTSTRAATKPPKASAATSTAAPRPSATSAKPPPRTSASTPDTGGTRAVSTTGGYVSGRCDNGLVTLSASPSPGWELKDLSAPHRPEGEVKFEQTGDGDGEVEVIAVCAAGRPSYSVATETGDNSGRDEVDSD